MIIINNNGGKAFNSWHTQDAIAMNSEFFPFENSYTEILISNVTVSGNGPLVND